jgi:lysophospholipid acyltransferase (LPLAT)-like uncharacterized protein
MFARPEKLQTKLGGLVASLAVRSWMSTLDFHAAYYDRTMDPIDEGFSGSVIAVFWHEYLLAPFFLRGNSNSAILTSQHRDADWLSEAARHMGFLTIRGSTYRGGTQALLKFIREHETRNLGVACDGPRGPRRGLAQGPVYLSSKLQIPLVAYGIGYDRPWRMPTWDCFALPRPGSRARLVMGPRMQIPHRLTRSGLEYYRQQVEDVLLRLTFEAEAWAEAGSHKQGQVPIHRQPAPLGRRRVFPRGDNPQHAPDRPYPPVPMRRAA